MTKYLFWSIDDWVRMGVLFFGDMEPAELLPPGVPIPRLPLSCLEAAVCWV